MTMKKTILTTCFLAFCCSLYAQQEISWKQLAKIEWTKGYVVVQNYSFILNFQIDLE